MIPVCNNWCVYISCHWLVCLNVLCTQVPDNYTPPAPITAPVMGFPVEAPQPHDHAQVAPGAPQEPSVQVSMRLVAVTWILNSNSRVKRVSTFLFLCPCFPQLLQQLPAERVEQKEIPAEHMVLKSTFDSLVQRCQLAARDPVSLRMCMCDAACIKADKDGWKKFKVWVFNKYKLTTSAFFSAN